MSPVRMILAFLALSWVLTDAQSDNPQPTEKKKELPEEVIIPPGEIKDLLEKGELGPFDTPPQVVKSVVPGYPITALATRLEGIIYVRVAIDEKGVVIAADALPSEGRPKSLETAAIEAARAWLFTPASQKGVPVKCVIVIPFEFELLFRVSLSGTESRPKLRDTSRVS